MPDMNYATLNSLTKYPSIPTYHEIDRGKLSGEAIPFDASDCHVTEKIDGTNGRIVIMPDGDFYIGSREELLHARCDRVINQNLGIVDVLLPHASRMSEEMTPSKNITVAYGEVYGHAIGSGSKNYTRSTSRGVRWFDLCVVPVELLSQTPEFAAKWRDNSGQIFAPASSPDGGVPRIACEPPPRDIAGTYQWLKTVCPRSYATFGDGDGRPEGVVVRTADRRRIVKIRYEDYERTLGIRR